LAACLQQRTLSFSFEKNAMEVFMARLSALKMAYAVYVLCAASANASHAQTFNTFASFDGTGSVSPTAQKERVLHRFTGTKGDGIQPQSALIVDAAGNLYGTTPFGGNHNGDAACERFGCGIVFELSPPTSPGSAWTEAILHEFAGADGAGPSGSLVLDQAGNLYGVTSHGGQSDSGVLFEVSPPSVSGGVWTETVLYNFDGNVVKGDPFGPSSPLVFDRAGNLYGVALGGSAGCGVAFVLTPSQAGSWTAATIYTFPVGPLCGPADGLVFDGSGNLYGVAVATPNGGALFRLSPSSGGSWIETTLHTFQGGIDGSTPAGRLLISKGALYGVTTLGGDAGCGGEGCGTVYRFLPIGKYTIIHRFQENSTDGVFPLAGLTSDSSGNLYGTTEEGGGRSMCPGVDGPTGCGTVFQLVPPTGTRVGWTEITLYAFTDFNGDGALPQAGLVFGTERALYGTTAFGGDTYCSFNSSLGCGTVFAVKP
jgi:uncharacterized repeat protein (TIGR03803 family)